MATGRGQFSMAAMAACVLVVAGCNRGPDPMTLVQSPAEYNCLQVVGEASGSRNVTLVALSRGEEGSVAQILSGRDGVIWTCRTTREGLVTQAVPGRA